MNGGCFVVFGDFTQQIVVCFYHVAILARFDRFNQYGIRGVMVHYHDIFVSLTGRYGETARLVGVDFVYY